MHGIKHARSQGLIDAAFRFAAERHGSQVRKYTGEPYTAHLIEVAKIVAAVTDDCEMISAALLHDVIEDTDATYAELLAYGFGHGIANLVLMLTDVSTKEDGNRATRKAIDRDHLATASNNAKTIKLADLISNSISICAHDAKFAKVYMAEKAALLEVLQGGDKHLMAHAKAIVSAWQSKNITIS